MSSKRKFTNEQLKALVKRSEEISIGQLAREIGVNKSTLQSNINRYKKDNEHKEQVAEMKAKGMEMLDISKELNIGLEEVEGIIATLEGREPRMITRNWTLEQKEQMYQMKCDNIPVSEIARAFNTTEMKVYKTIEMYVAKKNKKIKKKQESKYIPTVMRLRLLQSFCCLVVFHSCIVQFDMDLHHNVAMPDCNNQVLIYWLCMLVFAG